MRGSKIKKERLKEFIEKFEAFLKKYPHEKLDMSETSYNGCGSPACHGGWIHAILGKRYDFSMNDFNYGMAYSKGANILAWFLGFKNYDQLKIWANENPEIWGNKHGDLMFACESAFNEKEFYEDGDDDITLNVILHKWRKVYERINNEKI